MGELLGEPLSVDCTVGISDQIGLELIPALGEHLGPPLGKALPRSTFTWARAQCSNRCFRMLHSSARDSETRWESC
jgi:hypothetical protein